MSSTNFGYLRLRKHSVILQNMDSESNEQNLVHDDCNVHNRAVDILSNNSGHESTINSLRAQIEFLKCREKKLLTAIQASNDGGFFEEKILADDKVINADGVCPIEPHVSFFASLYERVSWLIGLLIFQSFSSLILSENEQLLRQHPSIIFFLTMLVGAGGNAGNQAAVRVIRGIAVGSINSKTQMQFLLRELKMAFTISLLLGATGLIRSLLSSTVSYLETTAITVSLLTIVFISIVAGATLPLLLHYMGIDAAHSSTSIQVIMDILGVLITCIISTLILDIEI